MLQKTQILVIGSGIAGLTFALEAAEKYQVTILSKIEVFSGNTIYAQGGIACVWDDKDSAENHIHDTLTAGAGHCKKDAVEILVKEAPAAIQKLINLAVPFCKDEGHLHLGREGGHSHNRIVHVKDFTGRALMENLVNAVKNNPNISILVHHTVLDLLTENNTCFGAEILENSTGEVKQIFADYTVLCTGGAGQVFANTTNPKEATGDGIAVAKRAGAKLKDLEFVQFHPTTLFHAEANGFLISEALRGAGAILVNKDGKSFMEKYHWQASLAPRDIVSRAIFSEMQKHKCNCVYLDARGIGKQNLQHEFPQIFEKCLGLGIDISKQLIPVIPSAHYMCGGVETDVLGQTSLHKLYALGEVACTGVHGANRLASNSLLEGLVFANRAFKHFHQKYSVLDESIFSSEYIWKDEMKAEVSPAILSDCEEIRKSVQQIMWSSFGIVRTYREMLKAYRKLLRLSSIKTIAAKYKNNQFVQETCNIWQVAILIAKAALNRERSLGTHYIEDAKNQKISPKNRLELHI